MRRALLSCALIAVAVAACSSSATPTPHGNQPPDQYHYGSAAPTAAPTWASYASQAPYEWPTSAPTSNQQPFNPLQPTLLPPVSFPSLGVNPYVDTRSDHVSTFGLDVDTASYTVARGYVARGIRPDPASVRPEEWVNYFDQGYAAPETGAFAIYADGGPTPFLTSGEVLLRVGVKAQQAPGGRRAPIAITFVIDVSGSMGTDNRLELVKQSLAILAGQLRDDDRIAIVAFSTDARVVLPPTWGRDRTAIVRSLAALHPENSTNVEEGLRLGYDVERSQFQEGGINRVVLATDGVANVGYTDAATILGNAGANTKSGIQLVAVGVGMGNFNDALLEQLADKGQGFYDYIDTIDEARRIFVDRLTSTIDTVALDGKAQIDFNPALVAGYRLIGYEDRGIADNSFRDPNATGGAIGAGHQVTALYAVVLRPSEGADGRLATINLRWTDPASQRAREIAQDVNLGDLSRTFNATDPHFKLDALVAATAEVIRRSPWIPGYSVGDLRSAAGELSSQLPRTTEVQDFMSLIDQLAYLR